MPGNRMGVLRMFEKDGMVFQDKEEYLHELPQILEERRKRRKRILKAVVMLLIVMLLMAGCVRGLFRCYGIRVDRVLNGERHAAEVQAGRTEPMPSKYPAKYRIDLHIDNDISVAQNGETYGFRVYTVGAWDAAWTEHIKQEIDKINRRNSYEAERKGSQNL